MLRIAPRAFNQLSQHGGKGERRSYSDDISQEHQGERSDWERFRMGYSKVLSKCFVLGDPAESVDQEGGEEILKRKRNGGIPLNAVREVVADVGHAIDEVHPPEFEGSEEGERRVDQSVEPILDALGHCGFAVGVLSDRLIEDGIGGRDYKPRDKSYSYLFKGSRPLHLLKYTNFQSYKPQNDKLLQLCPYLPFLYSSSPF